jgi:hypothetical protein
MHRTQGLHRLERNSLQLKVVKSKSGPSRVSYWCFTENVGKITLVDGNRVSIHSRIPRVRVRVKNSPESLRARRAPKGVSYMYSSMWPFWVALLFWTCGGYWVE